MTNWLVGSALTLGLVFITATQFGAAQDQDSKTTDAATAAKLAELYADEAMQKWIAIGQPGEHHEILKTMAGSWDAKTKMWMDPTAPATESTGTFEIELILDGRFTKGTFKGDFMGAPFEGFDVFGYDNHKQKYTDYWMDSYSTNTAYSEGTMNEAGNVITMQGSMPNVADGTTLYSKSTTTIVNPDTMIMVMWHATTKGGAWVKAMEMTYTRSK